MFTVVAQKNLGDAESYFDEHLSQNDYYAAGEIRPGRWIGAGAERLGLKGEVTREQFHALCENRNPETGERLTQRQLKEGQRRVFYDFTCSAPKSVSVMAVTLADDRLVTAHEEATCIAFRELETFAATRVRKQGNQRDRTTGNLAAPTESASNPRDNPSYGTDSTVATLNVMADDGKSYQLPYAQFLYAEMISNPALETKPDAPPEKLLLCFAVAEVAVLGSGLKAVERAIQKYELKFVKSADRRYAATFKTHVAAVAIAFTEENV